MALQASLTPALVVPLWGQDLGLDTAALAAFRAGHPGLCLMAACLGGAEPPEGVFDRIIRLPLAEPQRPYAEAIGMQLCLNEARQLVGVVRSLAAQDLAEAERHFAVLGAPRADAVIVPGPERSLDRVFVSVRAAFLASAWAAMSGALLEDRATIAAGLLALMQRRGAIAEGERHAELPRIDLGHFAAKGQAIREKIGLLIGKLPLPAMTAVKRIAVVTPYYKEPDAELRRAIDSVRGQSMACDLIMVSDGFPNPLAQAPGIMHVALGAAHADNGNTPRYVGAMLALALGYDAVAFLDADNWFEPKHIERLVKRQHETNATAVFSLRNIYLPDGFKLPAIDHEDKRRSHVDTSCMMLTRACEFAMHLWGQMPQEWGPVCDRVVYAELGSQRLAWSENRTLNFKSNYGIHFHIANRPLPEKLHRVPSTLLDDFERLRPAFCQRAISRSGRVTRLIGR